MTEKCPTCGADCIVGGEGETHYFVPVEMAWRGIIAEAEAMTGAERGRLFGRIIQMKDTIRLQKELCDGLRRELDRYTRRSESGESLGDALDMAEEIERLNAELDKARNEALEEAAKQAARFNDMTIVWAIRSLKTTEPTPPEAA